MTYDPKHLQEIDYVEVVKLGYVKVNTVSEYMLKAKFADFVRINNETSQQITRLWRNLPASEQMRCHNPPFGLRFYKNEILILQASICWECNNIFGDEIGQSLHYKFDGEHKISKQLLLICKNAFNA
jgi:hypothetical protein